MCLSPKITFIYCLVCACCHVFSPLGEATSSSANCSWDWGALPAQVDTNITRRFVDDNGDNSASVGEGTTYNVTITNDGKVCGLYIFVGDLGQLSA